MNLGTFEVKIWKSNSSDPCYTREVLESVPAH